MNNQQEIYTRAQNIVAERRRIAQAKAAEMHKRIAKENPRIISIEQEISHCVRKMALNEEKDIQVIQDTITHMKELQEEMSEILKKAGETVSDFSPPYTCAKCEDTGICQNHLCDCMKSLMAQIAAKEFNRSSGMQFTTFEDMDLKYYSDRIDPDLGYSFRDHMKNIITYCCQYADAFAPHAENLLLVGNTGVGKTHVALAIAGKVYQKGFIPVYHPAQQLFRTLEREHFGKEDGDTESLLLDCDLLVLDDLGTEMTTAFTVAALYDIINGRLLRNRPTIISTNLAPEEWAPRYGEAIASRVLGTYETLLFLGQDIRQQKMEQKYLD